MELLLFFYSGEKYCFIYIVKIFFFVNIDNQCMVALRDIIICKISIVGNVIFPYSQSMWKMLKKECTLTIYLWTIPNLFEQEKMQRMRAM